MTNLADAQVDFKVPEILRRILMGRGIRDEALARFLKPDYERDLHDPFLLTDMQAGVKRVVQAIEGGEKVTVYGDYDIDGLSATALMLDGLSQAGAVVDSYIPDRFEEGYGLNQAALERLRADGTGLVVTVDCGITSLRELDWAKQNGLDVVVTDHHEPGEQIPEAVAVINPKRPGDLYPFKELAGAGVAFKFIQALQQLFGRPELGQEKWLLDLVALGTICDHVALVGENRVLAQYGLKVLAKTRRPGVEALAAVAGVELDQVGSFQLGFGLGPRLNAAGRLEHANRSLELLTTDSPQRAGEIAQDLNELNRQRQSDQAAILAAASAQAEQFEGDDVLVLADAAWSHGIVGIVASKLVERYRKPALVAQVLGDEVKGSARSTGNFSLAEGLAETKQYLTRYGGHHFAAGFSLKLSELEGFRAALNKAYVKLKTAEPPAPYRPEAELEDLAELDEALYEAITTLEPFGHANPEPVFGLKGLAVTNLRLLGGEGKHLKLWLEDGGGRSICALAFGQAEQLAHLKIGDRIAASVHLTSNTWQNRSELQLKILRVD